jgi:epoxyqueuosine reductase QueG
MEMCPAGAIKEKPENFDHIRCYEKIREMTNKRRISQNICGLCIKACDPK